MELRLGDYVLEVQPIGAADMYVGPIPLPFEMRVRCARCLHPWTMREVACVWGPPDGTTAIVTADGRGHARCPECGEVFWVKLQPTHRGEVEGYRKVIEGFAQRIAADEVRRNGQVEWGVSHSLVTHADRAARDHGVVAHSMAINTAVMQDVLRALYDLRDSFEGPEVDAVPWTLFQLRYGDPTSDVWRCDVCEREVAHDPSRHFLAPTERCTHPGWRPRE